MVWDTDRIPKTIEQVVQALADGNPIIIVSATPQGILLNPSTLEKGEERVVVDRVSQVLTR